jgi:hypothetical protein
MLSALVLQDYGKVEVGEAISTQVREAHKIIADGVADQDEQVDVVVLNGERLHDLVGQTRSFFTDGLQATLREYGEDGVEVTDPFAHLGSNSEGGLRGHYGALRFLTDVRPTFYVAYRLGR